MMFWFFAGIVLLWAYSRAGWKGAMLAFAAIVALGLLLGVAVGPDRMGDRDWI